MRFFGKFLYAVVALAMIGCLGGCNFGWTTSYVYQNGEKYTAGDREITEKIETIDIHYLSGSVELIGTDSDVVSVRETSDKQLDDKRKVHTWVDGTTLYVRYCASAKGLDLNRLKKQLKIEIPGDVALNDLKVKVSSGDVECKDFEAENLSAHASSGDITVFGAAKKLELNASSGDVTLIQQGDSEEIRIKVSSGKINVSAENAMKMDVNSSSGRVKVSADYVKEFKSKISSGDGEYRFTTVPEVTDVTQSSGDVALYLPKEADLTASFSISSGKLFYELAFSKNGKDYVSGSGANQMKVHVSSGDVDIRTLEAE